MKIALTLYYHSCVDKSNKKHYFTIPWMLDVIQFFLTLKFKQTMYTIHNISISLSQDN